MEYSSVKLKKLSISTEECKKCHTIIKIGKMGWQIDVWLGGHPLAPENNRQGFICACCAGGSIDCRSMKEKVSELFIGIIKKEE